MTIPWHFPGMDESRRVRSLPFYSENLIKGVTAAGQRNVKLMSSQLALLMLIEAAEVSSLGCTVAKSIWQDGDL